MSVEKVSLYCLAMVALIGALPAAFAQSSPKVAPAAGPRELSEIQFRNADVREAIRSLFKRVNEPYSIDPAISGRVTLTLKRASLKQVLEAMLPQVDAEYRVEAGIYNVLSRRPSLNPFQEAPPLGKPWPMPQVTQDVDHLYILREGVLYKVQKSDLKTVAHRVVVGIGPDPSNVSLIVRGAESSQGPKVTLQGPPYKQADVREVLRALFRQAGASYTISPEVEGKVTADFENVPLDQALRMLGRQVPFTFNVEVGIYNIFPPPEGDDPSDRHLIADDAFLYFIRGRSLSKYRKSDLVPTAEGTLPSVMRIR